MPNRTASMKKAEQLLGAPKPAFAKDDPIRRAVTPQEQQLYADRLGMSEELGPDWQQNQRHAGLAGASGAYAQRAGSRDREGHHYLSKIMSAGRKDKYAPGNGLYAPGKRLDEWKTAGIASLTGPLVDIEDRDLQAHEADLDKAWWEAGNKGKRKPAVKRDTMDGSHETANGTVTDFCKLDATIPFPKFATTIPLSERHYGASSTKLHWL